MFVLIYVLQECKVVSLISQDVIYNYYIIYIMYTEQRLLFVTWLAGADVEMVNM